MICIVGSFEALPVSGSYDQFVRRPTGVIEKPVAVGEQYGWTRAVEIVSGALAKLRVEFYLKIDRAVISRRDREDEVEGRARPDCYASVVT